MTTVSLALLLTLAQPAADTGLYETGVAARAAGRDQEAYRAFSEAWQKQPSPRALAQLGLAAQALGRWAEAETHLAGALAAKDDPWVNGKRAILEDALGVVARHMGSLDVVLDAAGGAMAATLLVDGKRAGELPLAAPLRLAAGTVVLEVHAPGQVSVQRTTMVTAQSLTRESVRLVPVPPAPAIRPALRPAAAAPPPAFVTFDEAPAPRWPRRAVYITGAAVVLGAGLATWSGLDTLSARDRYRAMPSEAGYRDGVGRQTRTNVLLISTGLLAASTAVLALVADWSSP